MYYLYILKSRVTKKLYIGYTRDLRARLLQHNKKRSLATKSSAPFDLVYYEAYRSGDDALKRERQLKRFKQGYMRLKERIRNSLEQN